MGKNLELASSRLMLGTDCQHVAASLTEHVQTVVHQLKAYLKELIRIPKDFGKRRVELSLDVEFEGSLSFTAVLARVFRSSAAMGRGVCRAKLIRLATRDLVRRTYCPILAANGCWPALKEVLRSRSE